MKRALVALTLIQLAGCNCGTVVVTGAACSKDGDCPSGQHCGGDKHCAANGGGDGGATGGGGGNNDGGGGTGGGGPCVTQCGAGCCTAGETCELGVCHLKCGTGTTRCGDVG